MAPKCTTTGVMFFAIIVSLYANRVPQSLEISKSPTIVESVKVDSPLITPYEIANSLLKSKRSPASPSEPTSSSFCPWGICKFPGFLFGAFFKVPDDMVPTPPPTGDKASEKNVIFIKTHEEQIADSEKTVIYLLPQKTQHSYKDHADLAQGESRNPFSDKFEVVYLGGTGIGSEGPKEPGLTTSTRPGPSRHVRRIMRRIKALKDPETVTSVSVSYSVSKN